MFATPPVIETEVFATLPETLRVRNRSSDFAAAVTKLLGTDCDSFLEGPSFDRQGNLYCVDVAFGRILRVDPRSTFSVVIQYDGEPNGLKIHRDGRLFVADRRHGIVAIDPDAPRIEPIVSRYDLQPFNGPNDLVFSPEGDLYFTDQGMSDLAHPTGRVFRLRAQGRLEVVLDGLAGPNGIALDPSGRVLYVAVTRSNCILKAVILEDGRATRVQNFIQLSGGGGPDGLAVDSEGRIAVAQPHLGAVWVFDARGEPRSRIDLARGHLGTNLAYGGSDGRRLYITEAETGTIQTAHLSVHGLPMFSHQ